MTAQLNALRAEFELEDRGSAVRKPPQSRDDFLTRLQRENEDLKRALSDAREQIAKLTIHDVRSPKKGSSLTWQSHLMLWILFWRQRLTDLLRSQRDPIGQNRIQ